MNLWKKPGFVFRQWLKVRYYIYRLMRSRYLKAEYSWGTYRVSFDWIGQNIFFKNFEEDESLLLTSLGRDKDVIFDVGANIGFYTVLLGKRYPNSRIFAFEPSSREFNLLEENVITNAISNANLFQIALSDRIGKQDLFIDEINHGTNSLKARKVGSNAELVQLITIDHFVESHKIQKVDLMKIDVEGSELEVLRGGSETILKYKPVIFIESWESFSKPYTAELSPVVSWLVKMDYEIFEHSQGRLHRLSPGKIVSSKDIVAKPKDGNK